MQTTILVTALVLMLTLTAAGQQPLPRQEQSASCAMTMNSAHSAGSSISYTELKNTATQLERARQATAKYEDVRLAEADGYHAMGPDVPGMGVHFVQTLEAKEFDIEKPPILLYQKNQAAPGGYSLVGVTYLWNGAEGPDGQPVDPPFPKSLARWHRHSNICVLPGLSNPHELNQSQCREKGGQFFAQAPWMVHAWIWKDNPAGVFSSENPALRDPSPHGN